ncbi:MAG TPA: hypothetical protein VH476_05555 [Solirubrobacterales bacterium]
MRSRLQIALALCAVAALGIGLSACGGGGGSSEESPQAVIENATLEGIESANLDLSLKVNSTGKEGSDLEVSVSGPFENQEGGNLPQMAIEATAKGNYKGEDVDFDGGLVLLPNSAFVRYEGVEYEVDQATFSFVESLLNRSQKGAGGESKGITGCRQAVSALDFTKLGEHLKNEGTVEVGGTDTTKLSGDLDPTGAGDLLSELSEDPACRTLLGAAGKIPSVGSLKKSGGELSESLKTAHVEFYVGEDDHIVRRVVAELLVEPKGSQKESSEIDLDLTLEGVNEEQEIVAPSGAKPLSDLFAKLGINPLELAGSLQRGEGVQPLLEQLGKGGGLPNLFGSGEADEGGEGTKEAGGAERALSYAECVRGARSAADLQKCVAAL